MKGPLQRTRLASAACALFAGVITQVAIAQSIDDPQLAFKLKLPEGFFPAPHLLKENPDYVHAHAILEPNGEPRAILLIQRLRGRLAPGRMDPDRVPAGFRGRFYQLMWQGFEVQAVENRMERDGVDVITHVVQIPLIPEGIQLKLTGRAVREAELRAMVPVLVSGIVGKTNWGKREEKPFSPTAYLAITIGALAVGLTALYLISKRAPRGTVLVLGLGLYVLSFVPDKSRVREIVLLSGVVRMLGFAAIILGIIDAIRKRKTLALPEDKRISKSP
ncbi:MAG TPA: hypothetical protein VFS19_04625 [Planctomycetota bacterium]|nr:hypothetical protein [Planctomycetota bacterium]